MILYCFSCFHNKIHKTHTHTPLLLLLFTINHLVSVRSFSNEIKSEKEIIEQTCEFQENISINQQEKPSESLNKWVKYINHLSIVALISGILFLLIFIILNI